MDTAEAAKRLGTTPRTLRQFLRSPFSTFVAVGSGSRYDFTDDEMPMLQKRFNEWRSGTRTAVPKVTKAPAASKPPAPARTRREPSRKDRAVWQEEGYIHIEDIRQPHVRKRVLADAKKAEDDLMMLLMQAGLHISQLGDSRKAS